MRDEPKRKRGRPKKFGHRHLHNVVFRATAEQRAWLDREAENRGISTSDLLRELIDGAGFQHTGDAGSETYLIAEGMSHGRAYVVRLKRPSFVARLYPMKDRYEALKKPDAMLLDTGDVAADFQWQGKHSGPTDYQIQKSLSKHLRSYRARIG